MAWKRWFLIQGQLLHKIQEKEEVIAKQREEEERLRQEGCILHHHNATLNQQLQETQSEKYAAEEEIEQARNRIRQLEDTHNKALKCLVCYDAAFSLCGHFGVCHTCITNIADASCPFCRTPHTVGQIKIIVKMAWKGRFLPKKRTAFNVT